MSHQFRAGHSPPVKLKPARVRLSHSLYEESHVFAANARGTAGRFNTAVYDPANFTMEDVQWDKTTYVLPAVFPPTALSVLRVSSNAENAKVLNAEIILRKQHSWSNASSVRVLQ